MCFQVTVNLMWNGEQSSLGIFSGAQPRPPLRSIYGGRVAPRAPHHYTSGESHGHTHTINMQRELGKDVIVSLILRYARGQTIHSLRQTCIADTLIVILRMVA